MTSAGLLLDDGMGATFCAQHLEGPTRDGVYPHQAHVTSHVPGLDAARPILDALAQPVVVTDLQATILYWNQSATDLYGFRADEALGHCLHSLLESPTLRGRQGIRGHAHWQGILDDPSHRRSLSFGQGTHGADDDDSCGSGKWGPDRTHRYSGRRHNRGK